MPSGNVGFHSEIWKPVLLSLRFLCSYKIWDYYSFTLMKKKTKVHIKKLLFSHNLLGECDFHGTNEAQKSTI